VSHCEFRGNSAGIDGGGLVAQANSQVTLSHCLFADNDAQNSGGGIYLNDADPTFTNCTISNNSAGSYGGGACLAYCADIEVENSIIAYNAQYGFYFQNAFLFETNIEYCDFFNNSVADYCFYPAGAAPVGLGVLDTLNANGDSCDVYGNIFLNPQFLDTINGNYHLLANSPCIDAGNPTSPWDPDSTITDIGAFYFDQTQAVEDYSFSLLPLAFSLECFPNPFNYSLALRFEMPDASQAELKIYDISGREIETLDIGHWTLGKNEVVWNAEGMPSGIYFIRLAVIGARSSEVEVRKVVLLK
jgi:parallel beta-helix repeat protein